MSQQLCSALGIALQTAEQYSDGAKTAATPVDTKIETN